MNKDHIDIKLKKNYKITKNVIKIVNKNGEKKLI